MDLRIENLSWMNSSTKKAAREKLAVMREKLAYPDIWRDIRGSSCLTPISGMSVPAPDRPSISVY